MELGLLNESNYAEATACFSISCDKKFLGIDFSETYTPVV